MEEKINIAAILKDKLENTKLYSPLFGDVYFYYVKDDLIKVTHHGERIAIFFDNGRYYKYPESESLLFPSKEMRDWSKFAWKKGDVLVNRDGNVHIIFEKFEDDAYKNFHGQYYLWEEGGGSMVSFDEDENYMQTSDFNKANKEDAQEYIHKIEKELGGKLNMETLEIEKPQPEFKDGDIVFMKGIKGGYYANCIFILRSEYKDGDERAFYYAFYNTDDKFTIAEYGNTRVHYSLRPATDSEKQQLFDALAKKGKTWDAEKKQIVDLKPKCEFKPFDKVLGRNEKDDVWEAELFSHYKKESQYPFRCIGFSRKYCIPYNEKTAHLLGTTDDWEGGEQ